MPAYEITYDLFKGDRDDYEELYDALRRGRAVRATKSSWYIATTWDAARLAKWLRKFMHAKDVLTVDELRPGSGHVSFGLSPEALTWRRKHMLVVLPTVGKPKNRLPR